MKRVFFNTKKNHWLIWQVEFIHTSVDCLKINNPNVGQLKACVSMSASDTINSDTKSSSLQWVRYTSSDKMKFVTYIFIYFCERVSWKLGRSPIYRYTLANGNTKQLCMQQCICAPKKPCINSDTHWNLYSYHSIR